MPMPDHLEQSLYELFDRVVGLSDDERQKLLHQLRESNESLADSLMELLAAEKEREVSESLFRPRLDKESYKRWLQLSAKSRTSAGASDLRELVNCFRWDQESHYFFAGSYRIGKCLSFSSLGATYFAEDRTLGRNAVLFFPYLRSLASSSYRDSFLNSTKIISKIFHPNVATIFGLVEEGSLLGVSRQWIPGEDLGAWLGSRDSLTPSQIALITQRLAEGLAAIHDANALHGDLKPANVIMPPGESITPVIIDFGTLFARHMKGEAQLGSSAWQGGTEGYIAPEVKQSGDLDERLDLYSLGQVLRKLLMHVAAGMAAEEITILRNLADDLTKEDPDSRPDTASVVIDRLTPISGRREVEVAAIGKGLEKVRTKSTLSLWTRRSVLAASATLMPYLLGRYAKVWSTGRASIKSHFIPGDPEDVLESIAFKLPESGVKEMSFDDAKIKGLNCPEEIYYSDQAMFWGITPDVKSVVIESEPIALPEEELRGNMVRIVVQCDAPPKSVSWELQVSPIGEQQSGLEFGVEGKHDQNWIRLGYRDNYFGGLTQRDLIGTIDPQVLKGSKKVKFRIVLSAKRKWSGQGWPPIMLVVKRLTPQFSEGGRVWLWFGKRA
jgi:serine/threonine protein kinase